MCLSSQGLSGGTRPEQLNSDHPGWAMTRFADLNCSPSHQKENGFLEKDDVRANGSTTLARGTRRTVVVVCMIGGLALPWPSAGKEDESASAIPVSLLSASLGANAADNDDLHVARLGGRVDRSDGSSREAISRSDARRIVVAQRSGGSFNVEDIAGPPGKPIPIRVKLPPEHGDLFRVLMFRGLPEQIKLTVGFSLDDAWAVSPSDISRLALLTPDDYEGKFSLEVLFIRGKGTDREKRVITVSISRDLDRQETAQDGHTYTRAAPDGADGQQAGRAKPGISPVMEKSMLERASGLVKNGDIAGARLVLEYLANQGSARGAFMLGQTYDPNLLDKMYIRGGVTPDVAKAREWYEKAASLGSDEAVAQLGKLPGGQ